MIKTLRELWDLFASYYKLKQIQKQQKWHYAIRTMAEFSDKAGATALANRAIRENWTANQFEEELRKL